MVAERRIGSTDEARARAFAGMVDRRALDAAYRYATLILGDATEAEDATHDAVLAAWRHFGELRDRERFDAWFGRILVNACRDRLRHRRRHLVAVESLDGGDDGRRHRDGPTADTDATLDYRPPWSRGDASTGDPGDAIARRMVLASALQSLSPEHREVVVLRFYLDLTVDQIAARTAVGSGTVKSRLHYALRRLRAAVGAPDQEGSR